MEDLYAGRWVLITGASMGLGEEFARQLAARRARLVLTARSGDRLAEIASELARAHAIETRVIAHDLGAPGGARALADKVEALGVEIDLLVSNAGFGGLGPVVDSDEERLADMVRLNCEALTVLTRRFLPPMVGRGRGGIIHLASMASFQPIPLMATYGATKAFVLSYSEAVAEEVRGSGVRVLALCPGPVPTGFQKAAGAGIAPSQRRAVMTAEAVVRRGLADYERGRRVCVPGAGNNVMRVGVKVLPRSVLLRTVARMMRQRPTAPRPAR